jgi:hypothetical protein
MFVFLNLAMPVLKIKVFFKKGAKTTISYEPILPFV